MENTSLKELLISFKEGDWEEIHNILMKEVYLLKESKKWE